MNNNETINIVTSFLVKFYHDEPDDVIAAKNAILSSLDDRVNFWRVSQAFNFVLNKNLPNGTLQDIITKFAKRDVWSDEEARQYLKNIYKDTYLCDVAGFYESIDQ